MENQHNSKNCVIEVYRGVQIKRYERVFLRVTPQTKKKIIDIMKDTGLSEKKIVCNSSKPCPKCSGSFITVFDTEGNAHQIPKGLISANNLL